MSTQPYVATSEPGLTIYGGQEAPALDLPAWAVGAPLNEWIQISGTANSGLQFNAFCGWGITSNGVIVGAATGGHGDGNNNQVKSLDLMADAPSWVLRHAESSSKNADQPYNPDGLPASRHTYHSTIYSPYLDRMLLVGCQYTSPNAATYPNMDGFNLDTDTWDAAGTYPSPGVAYAGGYIPYGAAIDGNGMIWTQAALSKYNPATNTWSYPPGTVENGPRFPWAWDSNREQLFGLCYGDGSGSSVFLGLRAAKMKDDVQTLITFNDSAAKTQWLADAPSYCGMVYDPENDFFLFYQGFYAGRVYKIIPNDTLVWDMELFSYGPGNVTPTASSGAGINGRFTYVPALKGVVMLPLETTNIYFMRTA